MAHKEEQSLNRILQPVTEYETSWDPEEMYAKKFLKPKCFEHWNIPERMRKFWDTNDWVESKVVLGDLGIQTTSDSQITCYLKALSILNHASDYANEEPKGLTYKDLTFFPPIVAAISRMQPDASRPMKQAYARIIYSNQQVLSEKGVRMTLSDWNRWVSGGGYNRS